MTLIWVTISLLFFVWGITTALFSKVKRRHGNFFALAGLAIFALLALPGITAENDLKAQAEGWANFEEQIAATKAGIADPTFFRKQKAVSDKIAQVAADKLVAENREKGFHCLSQWDGNSADFIALVTARLREPSSFEVIETRITPRKKDGLHQIFMQYRAKNGFGGMNIETALGSVVSATCEVTFIAAE